MIRKFFFLFLLTVSAIPIALSQTVTISGHVTEDGSLRPVEFATLLLKETQLWAITDEHGSFTIRNVPTGKATLTVQCLGYAPRTMVLTLSRDVPRLTIRLKQENLKLDEVTVTARRKRDEATTSYTIDRAALDNQQVINIGDIAALLPGGKTVNPTLMSDARLALRSGSQEKGNASFGTAIEVDGMRIDNNAASGETAGASTRTIGTADIESVEIVTGIPSVEYGDLSNGIVKVNTRRGESPFIVEGKLNQHTRQVAVSKGLRLGAGRGVLNTSLEHARSFSDAASPHTAYQRNIVSVNYMNTFCRQTAPLTLNAGLTANIGGYNSEADPDNDLDDYSRQRDNSLRMNTSLNWLIGKPWLSNLAVRAALSYGDRKSTAYTHAASASTQPYIHTTADGYFIAQDYDLLSEAERQAAPIILGPTGYWHVKQYHDSKPLNWNLRLKADWNHRLATVVSHTMAGIDYSASRNNGRGTYYDDMRYAPTWRPYRFDRLPTTHNIAVFAEEKVIVPTGRRASFELTAGLRDDITAISRSDYGTLNSLSPRVNGRYIFWRQRRTFVVTDFNVHAGWGKSVKLPSFQVLYPAPAYSDRLAFASPSTADNTSFYAYHTQVSSAAYNPQLRWQHTLQTDLGLDLTLKGGTHLTLSAFHHRTRNPYMAVSTFSPVAYLYTAPAALDAVTIPAADRIYAIDRQTGIVSVTAPDSQPQQLDATSRHIYQSQTTYVNASPVNRYGLEWTLDLQQIRALRTSVRFDGSYYYYKGVDDVLFADIPLSNATMADGQPYQYVGYYRGSSATSTGYTANASVANGMLSRQLNLNTTLTTHLPQMRLIVALRIEASLYSYTRQLSELENGQRAVVLADKSEYTGTAYDGSQRDCYLAVYPEYYSTWDRPDERLPFLERFLWAKDNDATLYSDLSKLVVRSNYPYTMNPNRLSAYYSANLSITKEIGDHVAVSFYANNFLNNMHRVRSSQTGLETSLFGSSYIPSYYYGLSLKLKL